MLFFSKLNPKYPCFLDFACQITLLEVSGVESAKILLPSIKTPFCMDGRGSRLVLSMKKPLFMDGS